MKTINGNTALKAFGFDGDVVEAEPSTAIVKVQAKPISNPNDMLAELARLQRENEELKKQTKAKGTGQLTFKVSEKGALSVYGLGRFPVTLYVQQWTKLFKAGEAILSFVEANKEKFATKE